MARKLKHKVKYCPWLTPDVLKLAEEAFNSTSIQCQECYGGFGSLDDEGVPRLGSIPCNHAVTVALGAKRSKSGRWLVKMPNSWGTAWGLKGFCWLPVDHLAGKRSFEGYEITVPNFDPGDTDKIPPLS
jgi:hypothetical protein